MTRAKTTDRKAACLHCGRVMVIHGRGLCSTCRGKHGVNEYPVLMVNSAGKPTNRPSAPGNSAPPPPDRPTRCGPGSLLRVLVSGMRTKLGFAYRHPGDSPEMREWDTCTDGDCDIRKLLTPGPLAVAFWANQRRA